MTAPANPAYFNKLYDPLFLYGEAVVSPGAGAAPNSAALMNPHGMPMELLEIRLRIYPNSTVATLSPAISGMGVGMKLDMGDIPLVDADVPISAFGTSRDDDDQGRASTEMYPDPSDTSVVVVPYTYRWRLKRPQIVPAGCVVTPLFTHLGQNHFPVTVGVLYICRTLPQNYVMPAEFYVPWVGSYNSRAFDNLAGQVAARDASSELDIVNPFRQKLELTRLTGRCTITSSDDAGSVGNFEDNNEFRYKLGKLRIRARNGAEIARTATPFNGLFPYGWRVWDIPDGWVMSPGEFYKVQLAVAATSATAPADGYMGSMQFAVSAIGFRKLPHDVFMAAAAGGDS